MCWRMSPSARNGGGHNGHGETGEYAVRRGCKSTFGWRLSVCV
jgi:environmental stress-induced protein Ves